MCRLILSTYLARAKRMADEESAKMAQIYKEDEYLQHFSVPRVKLPDLVLDIPFIIEGAPDSNSLLGPIDENTQEILKNILLKEVLKITDSMITWGKAWNARTIFKKDLNGDNNIIDDFFKDFEVASKNIKVDSLKSFFEIQALIFAKRIYGKLSEMANVSPPSKYKDFKKKWKDNQLDEEDSDNSNWFRHRISIEVRRELYAHIIPEGIRIGVTSDRLVYAKTQNISPIQLNITLKDEVMEWVSESIEGPEGKIEIKKRLVRE